MKRCNAVCLHHTLHIFCIIVKYGDVTTYMLSMVDTKKREYIIQQIKNSIKINLKRERFVQILFFFLFIFIFIQKNVKH